MDEGNMRWDIDLKNLSRNHKKCENKNLIYFFSLRSGLGRTGLSNTKSTFEAQFMIKLSNTKSKK